MILDKQVIVDGILTNYRLVEPAKSTPLIIMLHGWGDDSRTFEFLQEELSKLYTVIAPDLPGFGKTAAPTAVWGLDEYANFVSAFTQKLKIKPAVILGHSNGGAIAIRGLAQNVLTAEKLVLLASAGIREQLQGKKKALRVAAKGAKLLTKPLPKSVQTKLKKKAYEAIGSDLFVAEHLQETFKRVVTDDVQADAAKITCPALLIYGSEDTATPPSYGKLFSDSISNSQLKIIPGVGHFVHHDALVETTRFIRNFIGAKQ